MNATRRLLAKIRRLRFKPTPPRPCTLLVRRDGEVVFLRGTESPRGVFNVPNHGLREGDQFLAIYEEE